MTAGTQTLQDVAEEAGRDLEGAPALEIVQWAADTLGSRWCVASSMADAVVPHLASRVQPGIDVIFLDTGYHFVETIGTRNAVAATLPVTVRSVTPRLSVAEQNSVYGADLFARDPDLCCAMRKVTPLADALEPYIGWAAGLRREESASRARTRVVEWDAARGLVKVNPIAQWTQDDVDDYIAEHNILVNPLVAHGYGSIGCEPCTQRSSEPGSRAGRWVGTAKTECGLHSV